MEATKLSGDGVAADLVAPEVTVAIAAGPSEGLALTSREITLVVPSSPRPASPSLSLTFGGPSFADDVVQQFDATHRLSELTAAWGSLSTLATSFGEKLQVSFFCRSFFGCSLFFCPYVLFFFVSLLSPSLMIILAPFSRLKTRKSCLLR